MRDLVRSLLSWQNIVQNLMWVVFGDLLLGAWLWFREHQIRPKEGDHVLAACDRFNNGRNCCCNRGLQALLGLGVALQ